jgi:environmental stress-induced protein Ves
MIEHARYFPCAGYTSMPWRNGAGMTREIVRAPAQGERFAWRLSLASLQVSGPFSSYAGYQRCVALVDGRGFVLHVAGTGAKKLSARGEHALFAGAAEARCELLEGACTDLSLMVHDPGTIDSVTRLDIHAEQSVAIHEGKLQALFALHGAIQCRPLGPPIPATSHGHPFKLNVHDTLLIHGRGYPWSISLTTGAIAELLLISFVSP